MSKLYRRSGVATSRNASYLPGRCTPSPPHLVNGANRAFSIQYTHSWKLGGPLMKNELDYRHRYHRRSESTILPCGLHTFSLTIHLIVDITIDKISIVCSIYLRLHFDYVNLLKIYTVNEIVQVSFHLTNNSYLVYDLLHAADTASCNDLSQ